MLQNVSQFINPNFVFSTYENSVEMCKLEQDSVFTIDDYEGRRFENIINSEINGAICCRGQRVCHSSPNMTLVNGKVIRCDGKNACSGSSLYNYFSFNKVIYLMLVIKVVVSVQL